MAEVKSTNMNIPKATIFDLPDILELQKTAFCPVANLLDNTEIQPMIQTYDELLQEFNKGIILKYAQDHEIVGSVRAYVDKENVCHVGKLIVHPNYQNKGIGKALMVEIEKKFTTCSRYLLFTGEITPNTLYLYTKLGYREVCRTCDSACMIIMEKSNRDE
ncbi:GNAT family N-acetyltransferase [Dysgonomonas termitidis]|uniref:GNAT family N-acetyltransferase n=1 Tax=Dysgonomonas termitidis TaxID=1516126 RepID=A0ABV9KUQ7_9BACT